MKVYFSPSTLLFYPGEFKQEYEKSGSWPLDAEQVEYKVFKEFALTTPPYGKKLTSIHGKPSWDVDPLLEPQDVSAERNWRDSELERADNELYKVQDSDSKAIGGVTEWRTYRKSLRDWPAHLSFPDKQFRPRAPDFKG